MHGKNEKPPWRFLLSELPSFFSNKKNLNHKEPFIIYADLESFIEKSDRCKSNFENSSKHIPSGFSSFQGIENKHDAYIEVKIA